MCANLRSVARIAIRISSWNFTTRNFTWQSIISTGIQLLDFLSVVPIYLVHPSVNVHILRSWCGRGNKNVCIKHAISSRKQMYGFIFIYFFYGTTFSIFFFMRSPTFTIFICSPSLYRYVCAGFFFNATTTIITISATAVVIVSIFSGSIFVTPNFRMSKCVCFSPFLPSSRFLFL